MTDLIKRSDALDAVLSIIPIDGKVYADTVTFNIQRIPSADRPVGEWIPMTVSSGRDSWKCSVCGRRARGKIKNLPYCHCGARMKGDNNEY